MNKIKQKWKKITPEVRKNVMRSVAAAPKLYKSDASLHLSDPKVILAEYSNVSNICASVTVLCMIVHLFCT